MRTYLLTPWIAALYFAAFTGPSQASICPALMPYYQGGLTPKALARGSNGWCGYATGQKAMSLEDAKFQALKYCASRSNDCRIISSQGGSSTPIPVKERPAVRRMRAQRH